MKKRSRVDFDRASPKEIDTYLKKEYGVRLLDFSGVTAQVLEWSNIDHTIYRVSTNIRIQNRFKKLKADITKTIIEYQNFIGGGRDKNTP